MRLLEGVCTALGRRDTDVITHRYGFDNISYDRRLSNPRSKENSELPVWSKRLDDHHDHDNHQQHGRDLVKDPEIATAVSVNIPLEGAEMPAKPEMKCRHCQNGPEFHPGPRGHVGAAPENNPCQDCAGKPGRDHCRPHDNPIEPTFHRLEHCGVALLGQARVINEKPWQVE